MWLRTKRESSCGRGRMAPGIEASSPIGSLATHRPEVACGVGERYISNAEARNGATSVVSRASVLRSEVVSALAAQGREMPPGTRGEGSL